MDKSGGAAKPPSAPRPRPPRTVLWAVIALGVSALGAIVTAVGLYTIGGWLTDRIRDSDIKADKNHKIPTLQHVADQVSAAQRGGLIASVIVVIAVGVLGFAVYRGRYWARWGVLGFWVLSTFTGQLIGISSILTIGASAPLAYKIPSFIAGLGFVAAVLLVNLSPSTQFFALSRPARPEGARQRRGLFAPRQPMGQRGPAARPATTRPAARGTQASTVDRSRSKTRAADTNAAAVAKGAELARSRAKASKSRRTDR